MVIVLVKVIVMVLFVVMVFVSGLGIFSGYRISSIYYLFQSLSTLQYRIPRLACPTSASRRRTYGHLSLSPSSSILSKTAWKNLTRFLSSSRSQTASSVYHRYGSFLTLYGLSPLSLFCSNRASLSWQISYNAWNFQKMLGGQNKILTFFLEFFIWFWLSSFFLSSLYGSCLILLHFNNTRCCP